MNVQVDVQLAIDDEGIPDSDTIVTWVSHAIDAADRGTGAEISIRIVGAAEIQALNREFRHKDLPTNVLSFPAGDIEGLPAQAVLPLGDIVVCASVVREESHDQGKTLNDHWAHMIVHGTLHLLGFDHQKDDEATAMEGLERRILAAHGVADPYRESPGET